MIAAAELHSQLSQRSRIHSQISQSSRSERLQAIKEYLRRVDLRLDQDQDHDRDQGRLRENAVQSCEGAPREASGQEGTARGVLFFLGNVLKSCSLPEISLRIEESGQNRDIITQVKRKEALAAASSLTTALVDHLNVGVAQVSFQ